MLKNNKAAGINEIASELLKYGGNKLKIEIWKVIKEIWMIEKMPENWNKSIICQIYKKEMQWTVVITGGFNYYTQLLKFSLTLFLTAYEYMQ